MNPFSSTRKYIRESSPTLSTLDIAERLRNMERTRRQQMLTPAAIALLVLALSGYLPATSPHFNVLTFSLLTAAFLFVLASLWRNLVDDIDTSTFLYIIGLLLFYGVALFAMPTGNGEIGATNFTAGNLYYLIADTLPIFGSILLLDFPWAIFINALVFIANMTCLLILPHDTTFTTFVSNLGGIFFIAISVTLGQIVLIVLGLTTIQNTQRAFQAAVRAAETEAQYRRLTEQYQQLETDIQKLQQAFALTANGQKPIISLSHSSVLYPIAMSLNLMSDRLGRLGRTEQELMQIERAQSVIIQLVQMMGEGDWNQHPVTTNTILDGLIASLLQAQTQLTQRMADIIKPIDELRYSHTEMQKRAASLVISLRQLSHSIRAYSNNSDTLLNKSKEKFEDGRYQQEKLDMLNYLELTTEHAEGLRTLIQSTETHRQALANAVERMQRRYHIQMVANATFPEMPPPSEFRRRNTGEKASSEKAAGNKGGPNIQ